MSKLKFDYIKIGQHKRPIIPVRLIHKDSAINIPALIDSGADFNVFPLTIANDLGLNLNLEKPMIFKGVGEKSHILTKQDMSTDQKDTTHLLLVQNFLHIS